MRQVQVTLLEDELFRLQLACLHAVRVWNSTPDARDPACVRMAQIYLDMHDRLSTFLLESLKEEDHVDGANKDEVPGHV